MKGADGKMRRGAVVALDPTTGAILAAVSTPSYDPNELSSHNANTMERAWSKLNNDPAKPMLNRAFNELYAPGSVFKVIFDAKYGEWLGTHMIGYNVTEIIIETVVARKLETTHHEVLNSIHPHPTISESVKDAIEVAYGEAIHL
jgi:hypothetical protein